MMLSFSSPDNFTDFYSTIQSRYEDNEHFGKSIPSDLSFNFSPQTFSRKTSDDLQFIPNQLHNGSILISPRESALDLGKSKDFFYSCKESISFGSVSTSSSFASISTSSPPQMKAPETRGDSETRKDKKKRKCVKKVGYKKKFKTEVCKFWAEKGFCEFGDNCAFAHGKTEMREKIHTASNYKTKPCKQYHENGFCIYGLRCQFVHCLQEDAKMNSDLVENSYANDIEFVEIWCSTEECDCVCKRRRNRMRLPCFVNLSNC